MLTIDSLTNTDKRLKNISNGLIAPKFVNITSVKLCGEKILARMSEKSLSSITMKKNNQAKQIPAAASALDKCPRATIDSDLLFQRLISVPTDVPDLLKFELAHFPMSLFTDNGYLRDSNKAALATFILDNYKLCDVQPNFNDGSWTIVLDGGLLLHKMPWSVGATFHTILTSYVKYVNKLGDHVVVVFDGYANSNTKDHCHRRKNPVQATEINFSTDMKLDCRKELFLSNNSNKQTHINLLVSYLNADGSKTLQHSDDADRLIVQTAFDFLKDKNVKVVADDTDVFVMLLSGMKDDINHSIYLYRENFRNLIDIYNQWVCIPDDMTKNLLFNHAMTGCDTTSGIHNTGKNKLIKSKILENNKDAVNVFYGASSSKEQIITAGEKILLKLFGKNKASSLDELRYILFKKRLKSATKKTRVNPRNLPPSSSAAGFHCLRVYHQIQEWLGRSLDPCEYGWCRKEGHLEPMTFEGPIAPEHVIKSISCKCKTSNCKSGRCSCNKFGLDCTEMCECTDNCENQQRIEEEEENVEAQEDV